MSSTEEILRTALLTSIKENKIQPHDAICVAYSGGPDSTALLSVLKSICSNISLRLYAVYIDHGLRSFSDRVKELRIVQATCNRLKIPLYSKFFPMGYISEHVTESGGIEASARKVRYRYLHKIRNITKAQFIALGHTSDDQVETVLMRCFQGSGPEGLKGIQEKTEALWRPLLHSTKADLKSYLGETELKYSIDVTNKDVAYTRNFVRHSILPKVREVFPGLDGALLNLAEKMKAVEELLAEQDVELPTIDTERNFVTYPYSDFISLPLYGRVRLLYRIYNKWFPNSDFRVPYRFIRQLCDCGTSSEYCKCGEGYGIRMEKRGKSLFLERAVVPNKKNSYLIVIQASSVYFGPGIRFYIQRKQLETAHNSLDEMEFTVKEPCVVRSRRSGDVLSFGGGKKQVKEILRELDIPKEKREESAVIEDRRGILGLVPLHAPYKIRWSRFAKSFKEADTILKIEVSSYR